MGWEKIGKSGMELGNVKQRSLREGRTWWDSDATNTRGYETGCGNPHYLCSNRITSVA